MWKPATALRVPRHDRELLGFLSRAPKTPQRVALRARIVLGAAAGRSINGLARELEVTRPTVLLWRRRYHEAGSGGLLQDAPATGTQEGDLGQEGGNPGERDVAHDAERRDPLEHAGDGAGARGERGDRATHLERARAAPAPGEDVQAES